MWPRTILNNLPIRYKIMLVCTVLFAPLALLSGGFTTMVMREALEAQVDRELNNSTGLMLNMIRTSVRLSIRNSLRTISETNAEIVKLFYQEYLDGNLTEQEAKARAEAVLLSQKIAKSGYLYCLDSNGIVVVHPEPELRFVDLSDVPFVAEQVRNKNGYAEYKWKNPEDLEPRDKAYWMTYFEPWDWIISASAYRDEFDQVVNIDDFQESFEALKFMTSGYTFVLDLTGKLIAHPVHQGKNVFDKGMERSDGFFMSLLTQKKGKLYYDWQNPGETAPRKKVVVFARIPEVNWVVASSAYLDDIYKPLDTMFDIGVLVTLFCLSGGALVAMYVSTTITQPLDLLTNLFAQGATGDYSVRMKYHSRDEVGQLSSFFNRFMEQLGVESSERKRLERQITEADDQERIHIGQELHDDLAPHLIGIEIMCRTLSMRLLETAPTAAIQAETIRSLVADATLKTRSLARGFCPIYGVDDGLGAALHELIRNVKTFYPVECQLYGAEGIEIRGAVAVHIYRIIQEAINNAVKHAAPSQIVVTLLRDSERFVFEVKDDGSGLSDTKDSAGMGLQIMNYRARMIGAELKIESSQEHGTMVWLRMCSKNINEGS
ncbi:MAG: cache domain-containing protein [Desulfuromusa sp.]|nr:cache domain-containing protein [Desulfuromusa sp.]